MSVNIIFDVWVKLRNIFRYLSLILIVLLEKFPYLFPFALIDEGFQKLAGAEDLKLNPLHPQETYRHCSAASLYMAFSPKARTWETLLGRTQHQKLRDLQADK